MAMTTDYAALIALAVVLVLWFCLCLCDYVDRADPPETPEQRAARVLAVWETLAARAAPPVPMPLPYFLYIVGASETSECSICLEPLRQHQLCSEVPACRHVFHWECLGAWARSNGSCPLCRAKIMPGSDAVTAADDMV